VDVGLHLDLTEHPLDPAARRSLPQWLLGAAMLPRLRLRFGARSRRSSMPSSKRWGARRPTWTATGTSTRCPASARSCSRRSRALRRRAALAAQHRSPAGAPWSRGKPRLIAALGAGGLRRLARAQGWMQNRHLLGVWDFAGDAQALLALVRGWLRDAKPGDLWMCHPAASTSPGDPIAAARVAEYQVLASPELGALLRDSACTCCR
jgi:hypothetical protein